MFYGLLNAREYKSVYFRWLKELLVKAKKILKLQGKYKRKN
jgi:hypothetical protein